MAIQNSPLLHLPLPDTRRDLRGRRQSQGSTITHAAQDESGGSKPKAKGKGAFSVLEVVRRALLRSPWMRCLRGPDKWLTGASATVVVLRDYSLLTPTMNYSSMCHEPPGVGRLANALSLGSSRPRTFEAWEITL